MTNETIIYIPLEIKVFNATGTLKNNSRDKFINFLNEIKYSFGFKEIGFVNSSEIGNLFNEKLEKYDGKYRIKLFNYLNHSVIMKIKYISKKNITLTELKQKIINFFECLFGFIYFSYNFRKKKMFEFSINDNFTFNHSNVIEHIMNYFIIVEDNLIINLNESDIITLNSKLKENYFSDKSKYFDLDNSIKNINFDWFCKLIRKFKNKALLIEIFIMYFKAISEKDIAVSYFKYWVIIEKIIKRETQTDTLFLQKLNAIVIDEKLNSKLHKLYEIRCDLIHKYNIKKLNLEKREDLKLICNLVIDFYFQTYLDFDHVEYFYSFIALDRKHRDNVDSLIQLYNKSHKEGQKTNKKFLESLYQYIKLEITENEVKNIITKNNLH